MATEAPRETAQSIAVRPYRARIICWIVAPIVLVVFLLITTGLHGKTGDGPGTFQRGDSIAMIGLGILAALGVLMFTRPRAVADRDGIKVRNVFGSYEVSWDVVRAVTFGRGAPWLTLDLHDDDVLNVMAVQAADKERAVHAARAIRALHAAHHQNSGTLALSTPSCPGVPRRDGQSGAPRSHPSRRSQVAGSGQPPRVPCSPGGSARWRVIGRAGPRLPARAFRRKGTPVCRRHPYRTDRGGPISVEPRVNDQIRAREVRLVGPEGEQVGIVPLERALQLAADVDLDLVEVAPMARPPVCKLMDFGKYKYESALKAREARRNQQQTVIKEMKLRPKIDSHDYETKKGHVVRFLKAGDKVKVTIMFRGREQSRPELGFRLLRRLSEEVADLGFVEAAPKQDGRNMIMVIAPHRATKAAANAAKETSRTDGDAGSSEQPPEQVPAEQAPAAQPA